MPGPEARIQQRVVAHARSRGAIAIKLTTIGMHGTAGWPDYLIIFKNQILFVEFKRPGGQLTALQAERFQELATHGFLPRIIDDVEDGKSVLDVIFRW